MPRQPLAQLLTLVLLVEAVEAAQVDVRGAVLQLRLAAPAVKWALFLREAGQGLRVAGEALGSENCRLESLVQSIKVVMVGHHPRHPVLEVVEVIMAVAGVGVRAVPATLEVAVLATRVAARTPHLLRYCLARLLPAPAQFRPLGLLTLAM